MRINHPYHLFRYISELTEKYGKPKVNICSLVWKTKEGKKIRIKIADYWDGEDIVSGIFMNKAKYNQLIKTPKHD